MEARVKGNQDINVHYRQSKCVLGDVSMKKRLIIIMILSYLLTSLEFGIFIEVMWHGWGGFGGISLEYTERGNIGIGFLIYFIPVSIIAILLIRIILRKKKIDNVKGFFLDCIVALFGIGISIGTAYAGINLIYQLGRQMTAFLIDYFNWMKYPIL